jgi:bla regulator protein BlaR1
MIDAICWMLIHSLWQGLFFTIVTGIVLVYTKKSAPAIRYNLLSGLFFLFMAVCALTFLWEWQTPVQQSAGLYEFASLSDKSISSLVGRLNEYLSEHASLIVMAWCLIFLFKCVRMIAAIVYTQRVRNYGVTQPPVYWRDKTLRFSQQMQIKKTVRLLESKLVKMPFVTGHWKPMIFIPLGLLTKLPEGEIEAVLLHELAHIRRNDYFMNFLQHIGESIFFFNPGLLWISSLLREERENCCDDMAIDRTKDKMEFVRALISFREYDLSRTGVAVPFPAGRHQLLQRVTRIVHNKNKSLSKAEKLFFIASFCVISLLLATSTHQTGGPRDSQYKIILAEGRNGSSFDKFSYRSPSPDRASADPVRRGGLLSFKVSLPAEDLTGLENLRAADNGITFHAQPLADEVSSSEALDQGNSDDAAPSSEAAEQAENDRKEALKIQTKVVVLQQEEMHLPVNGSAGLQAKSQTREQTLEQAGEQARRDKFQAEKEATQTVLDRQQADRDREQAQRDRLQADRDREQAGRDRVQADRDRTGAMEDQRQAEKDRLQGILDRQQADRDRAQAEIDRKQAEREREQAEKDRVRTTHSQH